MVLRALAADPRQRYAAEARRAAELLKQSFFQPDAYHSLRDPEYWTRFVHWWPNLLTALESLSLLGFTAEDHDVARALGWFQQNQQADGSWRTNYWPGKRGNPKIERVESPWVTLRIARVLRRLCPAVEWQSSRPAAAG